MTLTHKPMPAVVLAANTARYVYAAEALAQAGLLERYLSHMIMNAPVAVRGPHRVQSRLKRLNQRRVYPSLANVEHSICWVGEGARSLAQAVQAPPKFAHLVGAAGFDFDLRRRARECQVLHAVGGLGTRSGQRVQQRGGLFVADQRWVHVDVEDELVTEACRRFGLSHAPIDAHLRQRLQQECAEADYVIVPSALARASYISRGVSADRVLELPLGVDKRFFRPALKARKVGPPRLLFIGRAAPLKGIIDLAEAVHALGRRQVDLRIAGGTDEETKRRILREVPEATFLPHIAATALRDELQCADLLVVPSIVDAWSMVTTEALACGTPVLVSDQVGAGQIVRPGWNGAHFRAGDAADLAMRLRDLLGVEGRLASMREPARQSIEQQGWNDYQARLLQLYRTRILTIGSRA